MHKEESYAETTARIAYDLARKRIQLFLLAQAAAALLPLASQGFLGKPTTPARRALKQKSDAAQVELRQVQAQQKKAKAAFQDQWADLDDAVSEMRDDMPFRFYLPYQSDDWDYNLDAYYQGLEALKADLTAAWKKASKREPKGQEANTLASELQLLFSVLSDKDIEKKYIQVLVQQPSILPEEY